MVRQERVLHMTNKKQKKLKCMIDWGTILPKSYIWLWDNDLRNPKISINEIVDSAAPAAHVDNLMDSQKTGCPQVTHNRLDKS